MRRILFFLVAAGLLFSCKQKNDVTVSQIQALSQVRCYQYTVQSLRVEEVDEGLLFDDKVCGYYNGHVDVGIQSPEDITMTVSDDGKSVHVDVMLSILNKDGWYIDGAPKYIDGDGFCNEQMKDLDREANEQIYQRYVSAGGPADAQKNLRDKMTALLKSFGYETIDINILVRRSTSSTHPSHGHEHV